MTSYRYVGGRKAVALTLPSGRDVSAERDETIDDVLPGDADALDRHPEWDRVETEVPAPTDPDEEPHE